MNQEPHFPKDFRILAIVNDKRQLTRQDTNEVIQFRPGSLIEIVFSEGTLEEGTQDPKLGKWKLVEFLPSGTEIYIDVNRSRQKWEGEGILTNNPLSPADYYLGSQSGALVRLDEDLKLEYAKGKQSKLHRCECTIVTSGQKARSLNHAYTLASRMFEKDRISNTGNVFQKCYYTRPGDSQRVRLSERRREVEAKAAGDSE